VTEMGTGLACTDNEIILRCI